jgi:hypothetical protein
LDFAKLDQLALTMGLMLLRGMVYFTSVLIDDVSPEKLLEAAKPATFKISDTGASCA